MPENDCDDRRRAETGGRGADGAGDSELLEGELTGSIIHEFFGVYNRLGPGYSESVYAEALRRRLVALGIEVVREARVEA
ncbi:hypothetical protein NQ358_24490, partial [Escherichia coli]|nr:hypothetical protein [Escherichia coli]